MIPAFADVDKVIWIDLTSEDENIVVNWNTNFEINDNTRIDIYIRDFTDGGGGFFSTNS